MLIIVVMVGVVILLAIVALSMLSADALRGAIGGRKTLERARRLMVVSTDDATERLAGEWIERFALDHPTATCVPVRIEAFGDGEAYIAVQQRIESVHPDALVWALPESYKHSEEGAYAMAKRELGIPIDAIYVRGET